MNNFAKYLIKAALSVVFLGISVQLGKDALEHKSAINTSEVYFPNSLPLNMSISFWLRKNCNVLRAVLSINSFYFFIFRVVIEFF